MIQIQTYTVKLIGPIEIDDTQLKAMIENILDDDNHYRLYGTTNVQVKKEE